MSEQLMLEALFAAVAEAVLSYVIDKTDPIVQLRHWLKRDLVTLAFKKALARTYNAFAREFPDLTASLFDQSFLAKEAAPELAKLLMRHSHPDPTHLSWLWAKSIVPATLEGQAHAEQLSKEPQVMRAASHFLTWLEAELKAEQSLQPLFDSRALESLPALEAKFDQITEELKAAYQAAFNTSDHYEQNVVNRSGGIDFQADQLNISGDVVGRDKITVIYNSYFSGHFDSLNDYYVAPDAVFQRVRIGDFIGREWLTAKVDAFLNDPTRKSGTLVLYGEAGVGKTSFLAYLVHERRYLHIFAEQVPGDANLSRALQSLGAQLVARYQLDPYMTRDTLPALSSSPDFLDRLLRIAAEKLTTSEKIVIVCDALDEAGTAPNGNVLGLPRILPEGVYLILSQRPVSVYLAIEPTPSRIDLHADDPQNLIDIETYLAVAARQPQIAGQLRAHDYNEPTFIQTLKDKSGGNWMYLSFVVDEIRQGKRAPLDLADLPNGLADYYVHYWGRWRAHHLASDEWDTLHLPVLTMLAAVQEVIDAETLRTWSGVAAEVRIIRRLLSETWRAYISVQTVDSSLYFRLNHASLRDFLSGHVNAKQLTIEGEYLCNELQEGTREAHRRIIEHFRERCGNKWPQLVEDKYARQHLTLHLGEAGHHDELFQIVAMSNSWAMARYMTEGDYAGYLADLERAWRWADSAGGWNVGQQVRCALIESSIHSLAGNLPPELLRQLVETGLWSVARALTYIGQMPDEEKRRQALCSVSTFLPPLLLNEAVIIARAINDAQLRALALTDILRISPRELKTQLASEVLTTIKAIDNYQRAEVLIALASDLTHEYVPEALEAARSIQSDYSRFQAMTSLVIAVPEDQRRSYLLELLSSLSGIAAEDERIGVIVQLATQLPADMQAEALRMVLAIEDDNLRADGLARLAQHLPHSLKGYALQEAAKFVPGIPDAYARADILTTLKDAGLENIDSEVFNLTLASAQKIHKPHARAHILRMLMGIAPHDMQESIARDALESAQSIPSKHLTAQALRELMTAVPDRLQRTVWRKALHATREIPDESARALAFAELADLAPLKSRGPLLDEALKSARAITSASQRADTLSQLVPHLPVNLHNEVLHEALGSAWSVNDERECAETLFALLAYLPESMRQEAFHRGMKTIAGQAQVLCKVLPLLPDEFKMSTAHEALMATRGIESEFIRREVLKDLAIRAPEQAMLEILEAVQELSVDYGSIDLIRILIANLPSGLMTRMLGIVEQIKDEHMRVSMLVELRRRAPANLKDQVIDIALRTKDPGLRASVLSGVSSLLPDDARLDVQRAALLAARSVDNPPGRAGALIQVASKMPDLDKSQVMREALEAIDKISEEWSRDSALTDAFGHLPPDMKLEVLGKVLDSIRKNNFTDARAKALSEVAAQMSGEIRKDIAHEALTAIRQIQSESDRASRLRELVSLLANEMAIQTVDEVFEVALDIQEPSERAQMLGWLACSSPEPLRLAAFYSAFASACKIQTDAIRAETFKRLASWLPDELKSAAVLEALDAAQQIPNQVAQARAVSGLISCCPQDIRLELLTEVFGRIKDTRTYSWDSDIRVELYSRIVSSWQQMNFAGLSTGQSVWCETLHELAGHRRSELLKDLTALLPMIGYLGGQESIQDMYHAICDVMDWWQ